MTDVIVPPAPPLDQTQEVKIDAKAIDAAAAAPMDDGKKTIEEHASSHSSSHVVDACRFCRGNGTRAVIIGRNRRVVACGACRGSGKILGWAHHAAKALREWGIGQRVTAEEYAAAVNEAMNVEIGV